MINPRTILNKLKWKKDIDFEKTEVWYVHRGAPNDTKIISGKEIKNIGRSFMKTDEGMIPFHRVFRIKYNNKTIFERKKDN